jgi:hypothetical protein
MHEGLAAADGLGQGAQLDLFLVLALQISAHGLSCGDSAGCCGGADTLTA